MKNIIRIGALLLVIGLLWLASAPTFGQTPPPKTPHLAYGESLDVALVTAIPTALWLDVAPGETFTVHTTSEGRISAQLNVTPTTEITPSNLKLTDTAGAYVYTADQPGPYLLTLMGKGAVTVSLAQGDTLSVDRGPIAFGDTVSGTGSELLVDAYTIDVPADSEFTLRLVSEGQAYLPIVTIPGLRDARQIDYYGDESFRQYYVVPAELAGSYKILVRMNGGEYTLTVIEGNDLWIDRGTLAPDTPQSHSGTVAKLDRYRFEATLGDVVTFVMDNPAPFETYLETFTAQGRLLTRLASLSTDAGYYQTYFVDETGPYYLYVQADTDYTVTMIEGPYLEGLPSVRTGDSLENTGTTRYFLEVAEESWVTIQTTTNVGESMAHIAIWDAAGNGVDPIAESRDEAQGRYQALFYLPKPAPYLMDIMATAAYSLSVTEGDTLRTDAGEIAVGQSVEGTAQEGQMFVYTLPSIEAGQTIAVLLNDIRSFRLSDNTGQWIDYVYFGFEGPYTSYVAYQLDGLCPCHLQITPNQPNYRVEIRPVGAEVFPPAQPLNLGEAVSGDTGEARLLAYTFQADTDGDLAIRVEFDPTHTAGNRIYMEVQVPGEDEPRYLILDHDQTETGDAYIVQHFPLYFVGEYTLRIKNLVGPYTLTVTLE